VKIFFHKKQKSHFNNQSKHEKLTAIVCLHKITLLKLKKGLSIVFLTHKNKLFCGQMVNFAAFFK